MPRQANGLTFLSIREVAEVVGRSARTIKNWYEWERNSPLDSEMPPLPTVHTWLDRRGTWYFEDADIPKLIAFRDAIRYGVMAEVSRRKWGQRGRARQNSQNPKKES